MVKIPLSSPNIGREEKRAVLKSMTANLVGDNGPVKEFEKAICKYTGSRYAVACSSGTAGLHMALTVLGIGPGDEVIVPTLTFIAPINAVRYVGAEPVFMDCDGYLNINCAKVDEFLHGYKDIKKVKAIICVHVAGIMCNMIYLKYLAKKFNLFLIEDAAEAVGSFYSNNSAGTIGDIGVFSFNANKIITTAGGGMVLTDNKKYADRVRYLINQAKDNDQYLHNEIGYNYRMNNLQGAMGVEQLKKLDKFIEIKKRNFDYYMEYLAPNCGLMHGGEDCNFWFYTLTLIEKRDRLIKHLWAHGIQTRTLWTLNHLQKPFKNFKAYNIKHALWYWDNSISLPCSTDLTAKEIKKVAGIINGVVK